MSVRRLSTDELALVLDSVALTKLTPRTGDDNDAKTHPNNPEFVLDLNHPLLKMGLCERDQEINAIEFDGTVTESFAERFKCFDFGQHQILSVTPEETLKRFVNVETFKIRGILSVEIDEWPDWVFLLRGLETIVDGDAVLDVGGLKRIVDDGDAVLDVGGLKRIVDDEDSSSGSSDLPAEQSVDGEKVSSPSYEFCLGQFKLISMMQYKKGILDFSARKENPFTRGKPVSRLVLRDDLNPSLASKVLNIDFAFSRISSISPPPLLRLFDGVVEVNLLQSGQEVKPYWTTELTKLEGILFDIHKWQRVDIGGIESTADGKFRFLLTPRITV